MKTLLALLLLIPTLSWGDKIYLECKCKKNINYYEKGYERGSDKIFVPYYPGKEGACDKNIVLALNFEKKNDFLIVNDEFPWGTFSTTENYYTSDKWIKHSHPLEMRPNENTTMWRINRMNGELTRTTRWLSKYEDGASTSIYKCEKAKSKF